MKSGTSRNTAAKSVSSHLSRDPSSLSLMAHGSAILKADGILHRIVPPGLARACRVANLKSGVVVIHTDHGAAASKLKQLSQQLVDEFIKKGFECTGIDVRVQPGLAEQNQSIARQKPLSEQALTTLAEVAAGMRSDSPLKSRLEHLISQAARRR